MKFLFTSIGRRVELVQAFKNAAQQLHVDLYILGADISTSAPALYFCDRTFIIPPIKSPDYIPSLLDICKQNRVDCLIPTIDTDLLILSRNRKFFSEIGTHVLISDPDKIEICRDKCQTAHFFQTIGLNTPIPVRNIDDYCSGFPAFIKPIDGSSSINAHKANSMPELATYAQGIEDYVVQPFVQGREYTVDVFCDLNGDPIFITPRERLAVRGGEVLKTQIHHDELIEQEILRLIQSFKPEGAITVQLIHNDTTNINYYIEINPRFGGGAPLSIKSGANSAQALINIMRGVSVSYIKNAAKDGAIYSRFDQSVCVFDGNQNDSYQQYS